jgi:hypothetical protein
VNPTVYPSEEFSAKLAAGHHFVTKVMERDKLVLFGDESDVAGVCGDVKHAALVQESLHPKPGGSR